MDSNAIVPDIVVEVLGPGMISADLVRRTREDSDAGVRLVCVIYPNRHLMWLQTCTDRIRVIPLDGHTFESLGWVRATARADQAERTPTVELASLIQRKLAARRYQSLADVVRLIRVHELDESYLKNLHPSLHWGYLECLAEKRRDDEFDAQE